MKVDTQTDCDNAAQYLGFADTTSTLMSGTGSTSYPGGCSQLKTSDWVRLYFNRNSGSPKFCSQQWECLCKTNLGGSGAHGSPTTPSPTFVGSPAPSTDTGDISEGIDCFTTPNTNLALCKRWIQCRDSGGQQCDDGNGNLGTILKMYNKGITGNIPGADLAMMTHLTELWLYANPLTGQIPNEIGLLTKLTMLSSGHNQMVGAGPGICAIAGNLKHCQIGGSWTNPSLCPTCLNTGQCSQTLARSNFGGCTKVTDSPTAPAPSMVGLSIVFCFVLLLVLCLFLH